MLYKNDLLERIILQYISIVAVKGMGYIKLQRTRHENDLKQKHIKGYTLASIQSGLDLHHS